MTRRVEVVDATGGLISTLHIAGLAEAVLREEGSRGTFSLALVEEATMTDLNRRYRGEQGSTDVLSFPEEAEGDCWPGIAAEDDVAHVHGEDLEPPGPFLGEVVVCAAVVERYAREEGRSAGEQLGWTIIHGTLHLLGYDHERDRGEMRAREQALLERFSGMLQRLSLSEES